MIVAERIEQKLQQLSPLFIEVINESHRHNVPSGSESHFKVVVVAAEFAGQRLLQRHRTVNAILADELAGPVHALALHTYSPDEWESNFGTVPISPKCKGGMLRDAATPPAATDVT
ncbi:MAG: transcriptional regulator BolA [Gammaproteobacteria bacterium]|nr:transcriptional regulator BolA [Gammaproteobacteria bacterium]